MLQYKALLLGLCAAWSCWFSSWRILWKKIKLHNLEEAWSWEARKASARITGTYLESKWSLEGVAFVFNHLHGSLCHKVLRFKWETNIHVLDWSSFVLQTMDYTQCRRTCNTFYFDGFSREEIREVCTLIAAFYLYFLTSCLWECVGVRAHVFVLINCVDEIEETRAKNSSGGDLIK